MQVISDTSPISYLVLIEEDHILPRLFGTITIPEVVEKELAHPKSPQRLRSWMTKSPTWLRIEATSQTSTEVELAGLDMGERAAILLAEQQAADLLLVDEKAAREVAKDRGLRVTGTLGVLDVAAAEGLIADLPAAVRRLQETSFRASPDLLRWLLERHR